MDLPKLAIAALGGTVSMQARNAGEGVIPTVSGETLLAAVPELSALARVTVETLGLLPSASLSFEILLSVLSWAKYQVEQGARGVGQKMGEFLRIDDRSFTALCLQFRMRGVKRILKVFVFESRLFEFGFDFADARHIWFFRLCQSGQLPVQ